MRGICAGAKRVSAAHHDGGDASTSLPRERYAVIDNNVVRLATEEPRC
jgi:hypothetical protein